MPDLGPLNVLICWQSILLAIVTALISHAIKTVIDISIGYKAGTTDESKAKTGRAIRKDNPYLTRLVIPAIPLIVGAILSIIIPMKPDFLVKYTTGVKHSWSIIICYGAMCGVMADYFYQHFKKNFQGAK